MSRWLRRLEEIAPSTTAPPPAVQNVQNVQKGGTPRAQTAPAPSFERIERSERADVWTPEDWRVYYLERAAIREFDGLLPRQEADRRAWRETANRWWHEHGSRSAPGICCGCGKPVSLADAIPLPHEQRVCDANCMAAFGRRWLREAAEALARFGIPAPSGYGPADK
jgi:hypothetical protein